jgi:hypothetical protein
VIVVERPILFSAPMVRAILAGQKTQTRRVLRDQDPIDLGAFVHGAHLSRRPVFDKVANAVIGHRLAAVHCPYGVPGDRLWVREAHAFSVDDPEGLHWRDDPSNWDVIYRADEQQPSGGWRNSEGEVIPAPWRPSIHMPRWASRITLEITGVRVERLQDISDDDARQEGVAEWARGALSPQGQREICRQEGFEMLWKQINGAESWDANPWVWVVEFKRALSQPHPHGG